MIKFDLFDFIKDQNKYAYAICEPDFYGEKRLIIKYLIEDPKELTEENLKKIFNRDFITLESNDTRIIPYSKLKEVDNAGDITEDNVFYSLQCIIVDFQK